MEEDLNSKKVFFPGLTTFRVTIRIFHKFVQMLDIVMSIFLKWFSTSIKSKQGTH